MAVTAPPQLAAGPQAAQPSPMAAPDTQALLAAQINAATALSTKASGADSAAEAKDFAQGVLFLAQAIVVLDPSLSQGGTPLAHDVALEQARGRTQQSVAAIQSDAQVKVAALQAEATRHARETAAAPSPAREKVAQP